MTTTEDLLRSTLHAQADKVDYEPTRAVDVATRARFARRRRAGVVALATAAAVAAVAVPVGLWLERSPSSAPEPMDPADAPVQVRVPSLRAVDEGAAPALAYVDNGTFVRTDGQRVDLGQAGPVDAAAYDSQVLVTQPDGPPSDGRILSFGSGPTDELCGSMSLAVSVTQNQTAYAEDPGCDGVGPRTLTWGGARDSDGELTPSYAVDVDDGRTVHPVAVEGDQVVANLTAVRGAADEPDEVVVVRGDPAGGGTVTPVPALENATAASLGAGLVAGCDETSCRVVDLSGATRFTLTEFEYGFAFSPDGSLLATRVHSGQPRALVVRDTTTGAALVTVEDPNLGVFDMAWEDDEHLLFTGSEGFRSTLLRLSVDGSLERTLPIAERPAGLKLPGAFG